MSNNGDGKMNWVHRKFLNDDLPDDNSSVFAEVWEDGSEVLAQVRLTYDAGESEPVILDMNFGADSEGDVDARLQRAERLRNAFVGFYDALCQAMKSVDFNNAPAEGAASDA